MDQQRQERLNEVARIAVKVEADTGVPAASTVAQWAVESQWGSKPVGKFNCFGVKKAQRHQLSCVVTTREFFTTAQIGSWNAKHPGNLAWRTGKRSPDGSKEEVVLNDEFADYASLEDSVRDYAWLVSNGLPYMGAWRTFQRSRDVAAFVAGIARAYSTSASYTDLVNAIAGQGNVREAIQAARTAA